MAFVIVLSWSRQIFLQFQVDQQPDLESTPEAIEFMAEQVSQYPNQVTLVAIGSLTNLAVFVRKKPELVRMVKEVVIMGEPVK